MSRTSHAARAATAEEITALRGFLSTAPSTSRRWKEAIESTLVGWAASLLTVVVVWAVAAWVARRFFDLQFGLYSAAGIWILACAVPICGGFGFISTLRWMKAWKDYRPALRKDIESASVIEERYSFVDVKRFQEPEHGGLMYFFHCDDGSVFTTYDGESQDLGVDDQDPKLSSFRPMNTMVLIRAPESGYVLSKSFSGDVLEVGEPIGLTVLPKDWPEHDKPCGIPWDVLEGKLAAKP